MIAKHVGEDPLVKFGIRGSMLVALALVAGCSPQQEEKQEAAGAPSTVFEFMTQKIDVDADAIWGIGNAAIDDRAQIDPSKMNDEAWTGLEAAAVRMAGDARALAKLDPLIVTRPGVKIVDEDVEGAPGPKEIQAHLDRDADTFRAMALALATHVDGLAAAARARDAAKAGQLINELDGVCEACHLEYWYPEQKALIQEIMGGGNAAIGTQP